MWLEAFGTVDERIFIAFGVVTSAVFVLTICNVTLTCIRKDFMPGRSLTLIHIYSSVAISLSVLFRGIQPKWGSTDALQCLCQIFPSLTVIGYTTFTATLAVKSWALVVVYKWRKVLREWIITLVAWCLIVVAITALIVWEVWFTPSIRESTTNQTTNSYDCQQVFVCGGQPEVVDSDNHQFAWRVSFSCYFAFIFSLLLASVPFHYKLSLKGRAVGVLRNGLMVITVNSTCCVVVAIVVWCELPSRDTDSHLYAVIGSLQLWIVLLAQIAILVVDRVIHRKDGSQSPDIQRYELGTKPMTNRSDRVNVRVVEGRTNTALTDDYNEDKLYAN